MVDHVQLTHPFVRAVRERDGNLAITVRPYARTAEQDRSPYRRRDDGRRRQRPNASIESPHTSTFLFASAARTGFCRGSDRAIHDLPRPEVAAEALHAAHFAVYEQAGDAVSSFDHETQEIRITVPKSAGDIADGVLQRFATRAVQETASDAAGLVTVRIEVSPLATLSQDYSSSYQMGGEAWSTCTSGFVFVRTTLGDRIVTTAGHCGTGSFTDDGDSLSLVSSAYDGFWGDWQMRKGPDTHLDNFYSGSSATLEVSSRDVSSGGVPMDGQVLCGNGKVSFKECDDVRDASTCVGANCYLIEMENNEFTNGDSGGVVFYWRTAYGGITGSHSGCTPSWPWCWNRDLFSRQDSVHEIWSGVYIATS